MSFLGMFLRFVLCFVVGALVFYQLPEAPPVWVGGVLAGFSIGLIIVGYGGKVCLFFFKERRFTKSTQTHLRSLYNGLLGFIIGISWAFWQSFFLPVVPESILNQPIWVTGKLIELPNQTLTNNRVRIQYVVKVESIEKNPLFSSPHSSYISYEWRRKPILTLNWYVSQKERHAFTEQPALGETWRMRVKLKANHASMNPYGFDYEAWLFQKGIQAKGYIKNFTQSERALYGLEAALPKVMVKVSNASAMSLYAWRNWIAQRLDRVFSQSEFSPFYKALTFGDTFSIAPDEWQLLQNTGTIHLMVISGLHMGIIAFLGYVFFKWVWRWVGYRQGLISLPEFAALGALLFATLYLTISGFSIPTQRAWLMVVAVLGLVLLQRHFQPWSALAIAAFGVVLIDTTSVLSFGFWLSFLAVGLIFLALQSLNPPGLGHEEPVQSANDFSRGREFFKAGFNSFKTLLWLQWVLTLGLAPFLFWAFNSVPVYSFIANLVAVPFISLLGLPWLFLTAVAGLFSVDLAQWMVSVLDGVWSEFWRYLQWVNQLPFNHVTFADISIIVLIGLYAVLFWGLKQRSMVKRSVTLFGVFLSVVSLAFYTPERPNFLQAQLTVLDVGQGLAVLIETQNHVVVYDLGAKWGQNMDGAKLAILPYLKARGWSKVDLLVVSHSDLDHAGGLIRLLENKTIVQAVSGQPVILNQRIQNHNRATHSGRNTYIEPMFSLCQAGQQWQWDGVLFEMLSPSPKWIGSKLTSDNDLSCVLKVSTAHASVMITGDLSQKGEALLLQHLKAESLNVDLLVAGHHGSKTSTSLDWLRTLSPGGIVFSSGYLNRFHFPSTVVLQRIQQVSMDKNAFPVRWWNTACSGGIRFDLNQQGIKLIEESRKRRRKWYHHRCLESQKGRFFQ